MEILEENNQIFIIADGKKFLMPESNHDVGFYEIAPIEEICDFLRTRGMFKEANALLVAIGKEVKAEQKERIQSNKCIYSCLLSCCEFCILLNRCKFIKMAKDNKEVYANTPLAIRSLCKCKILDKEYRRASAS